ncbi:MAG TPA: FtsX-like permease family protein [Synergistaceae bacterium]|nr:FtsX-like permease family protein [Synergistaceae bacterium]HPQ37794.1 FtsX-like permease family protein [Synergistaceae bacterium]
MKVLTRKLLRDILRSRGMLLAVILVITAGNTCFVALLSSYFNLSRAKNEYYREYFMADFWVELKKCPTQEASRILADFPDIARVRQRIVFPARVDIPEASEPVNGMVLSLPGYQDSTINGIALRRGSYFTYELRNQVICSDKFARARGIEPGDILTLITGGVRKELVVTGTADSPEYIYLTAPGSMVDDPESYGIFYVKQDFAEDLFNYEGACNNITGLFSPEGRRQSEYLLRKLSEELAPYGVYAAYSRKEQFSALLIDSEIEGLRSMSIILPLVFLGISALILNVLMTRIAEQQRTTVGTLKALGYSNGKLVLHYLGFGIFAGITGGLLGGILGFFSSQGLTVIYRMYFTFPRLYADFYPFIFLEALGISVFFASLGTLRGLHHILRLRPAEAMRLPAPPRGESLFLERYASLWKALGFRWQMVLRSIFRQPMRSFIALLSSSLGAAILLLAFGFVDSMDNMMSFQFEKVLRSDYRLTFKNPVPREALQELSRLPGVLRGEPLFSVGGTFTSRNARKRGSITGILPEGDLLVPRNQRGNRVPLPSEGLLMTDRMARDLGLRPGDSVSFLPVRGEQRERLLPVTSVVYSALGLGVYAPLEYLEKIMREEETVTEAALLLEPRSGPEVRTKLLKALAERPEIESISDIGREKRILKKQFDGSLKGTAIVMILFAGIIFFGSILNGALISLEERKREIATLKVLGYHNAAIGSLFFREILITNLSGAVLGMPLGYFGLALLVKTFQNDIYAFPGVVFPLSYLWTLLLAFLFVLLSYGILYRSLCKLPWREALNVKE